MILIVPLTTMNEIPPSSVFNRLLSMLLNTLPTIVETVGNSSAEHKIRAPDTEVDVSFCMKCDDESSISLWNICCKLQI